MSASIKKIGVLTSGGDAPGMNAAIRSVVRTCAYHNILCMGIYRGFEGMIEGDIIEMGPRTVKNIVNKGGTILKSARSMEFKTPEGRKKAYEHLKKLEIDALVIIGGDGSFTGGLVFNKEFNFPVMGIPGTIDNDIFGTMYTLGYDTALNTVVEVIDKIRDTANSHNRLFFVEVMGRDAGHIALNAGIGAGAEEILIPEENLGLDRLLESLKKSKASGKSSSIVVVSEGDKIGKNVFELKDYVEENMPEYDVRVSVLGHMQRGGSASCFDRVLGSRLGVKPGKSLIEGQTKFKVRIKKFDTHKKCEENKLSIQEAARVLRYEWFEEIVNGQLAMGNKENPIHNSPFTTHLLTAHHADDNAETVLMNFCRGTGLHGLTGIPVSYGHIKRPMLCFTREEILEFAKENKLEFVGDSSNQSSKYTRNFFRNEIIPAISKVYPQVKENLADNIERFKGIEKLYKLSVADIKKKLVREKGSEWHIPVKQLLGYNNHALIYEIISGFGFGEKQIDEVLKLAESESGRYIDSPTFNYRLIKHRHWFIISPVQSADSGIIIIEQKDKSVGFEKGILQIEETSNFKPQTSNSIAVLDFKEISFPLILRKWKQGDYFYPLGMKKKKKLSRFFIDNKLSKPAKEKIWVIESDKKIIWVVGHRIDERFKITDKTKSVLRLNLVSSQTE